MKDEPQSQSLETETDDASSERGASAETESTPLSNEDRFELELMEQVEKNECLYDRSHPFHKIAAYKRNVWNQMAESMKYSGTGIELERKFRHMRDRFVRIKKATKLGKKQLKPNDKWYFYVQKMNFLDPFIEHRRRKKKSKNSDGEEDLEGEESDGGEELNPLTTFYENFINSTCQPKVETINVSVGGELCAEGKDSANDQTNLFGLLSPTETKPLLHLPSPSPSQPSPAEQPVHVEQPLAKKPRKELTIDTDSSDNEVTHFVRSIEKSLAAMDSRCFAQARFEISRVIFQVQFGAEVAKHGSNLSG